MSVTTQQAEQKNVISFHRSYRRVTLSGRIILGGVVTLICTLAIMGVKIFFMPELTLYASRVLSRLFDGTDIEGVMVAIPFIGDSVLSVFSVQPQVPSFTVCVAVIGIAVLSLALLYRLPLARPIVIIVNLLLFMVAFYAALFLLIPGHFNDSTLPLGTFFMEIALVTGIALPGLFWMVIFPLPTGVIWKLASMAAFEAALFCLFWLKYALLIVLCGLGTSLVTPLVVFFLCSTLDIMYMVMLYSLLVSSLSKKIAKDTQVWQWA